VSALTGRLLLAGACIACVAGIAGVALRSSAPPAIAPRPELTSPPVPPSEVSSAAVAPDRQLFRPEFAESIAALDTAPLARGERARLAVQLDVAAGYHVNANPPTEDWLIATAVALEEADGITIVDAFYPQAEEKEFGFWSGPLRVYEGAVVIGVIVEIEAGAVLGGRDLKVAVTYQACNDDACFAPTEARTSIPVRIVEAGTPTRQLESPLLARARFTGSG